MYSLRAYLAVLYKDPRMKIYVRGKKVPFYRFSTNL